MGTKIEFESTIEVTLRMQFELVLSVPGIVTYMEWHVGFGLKLISANDAAAWNNVARFKSGQK